MKTKLLLLLFMRNRKIKISLVYRLKMVDFRTANALQTLVVCGVDLNYVRYLVVSSLSLFPSR